MFFFGKLVRCRGAVLGCNREQRYDVGGAMAQCNAQWYNGASVRGATIYNVGVVMVRCSRSGMGKLPNGIQTVFVWFSLFDVFLL